MVRRAAGSFVAGDDVRIGAEVEWLVYHRADPTRFVSAAETAAAATGPLPAGGSITIEPGGQPELITKACAGPRELIQAVDADTAVLVERFVSGGLVLVALGLDPVREPRRTLDLPRYAAMERYFATRSPTGLRMMSLTASLQLNIDFGPDPVRTWRLAHAVAPVLAAAFANSPTVDGADPQPVSHRQQVWADTDPSRTRPVGPVPDDWATYVLDAQVMLRSGATTIELMVPELTFGEWIRSGHGPSAAELELHLTTLWPPLRPRRFLEIRMIDALPATGRAAAIATVWALLTDGALEQDVLAAVRPLSDPWAAATEHGLLHTDIRNAAVALLDLAERSLSEAAPELAHACRSWRDEHVRSPVGAGGLDELVEGPVPPTTLPPLRRQVRNEASEARAPSGTPLRAHYPHDREPPGGVP